MNSRCAPSKLNHALDTTYHLQQMQYETDATTRRRKTTNIKIKRTYYLNYFLYEDFLHIK